MLNLPAPHLARLSSFGRSVGRFLSRLFRLIRRQLAESGRGRPQDDSQAKLGMLIWSE